MFDSDRRHPDELDHGWSPQAPETCQGFEVERLTRPHLPLQHWMLRRRFIESYMPKSGLVLATSHGIHPDAIDSFLRLSQHGRWYFNMKRGFDGDQPAENRHRCRDLYANVNPSDAAALASGFGRKLADHYSVAPTQEFDWDTEARDEASAALPQLMRLL